MLAKMLAKMLPYNKALIVFVYWLRFSCHYVCCDLVF